MHNIYTRLAKGFCFVFVSFWTLKVEPGTRRGPRGGAGAGRTVGSELQRKTQEINGRIYPKKWLMGCKSWSRGLADLQLVISNSSNRDIPISCQSKLQKQFSVINDEEKQSYFTFSYAFALKKKKKRLKSAIRSVSTILSFLAHTWNAVILSFTDLLVDSEG